MGRHTNEDNKGKKFLGGGDLRAEAGEGQQKLKKIEDFNAGPSKPMTNEGKLEALKVAMSEVGVPKALFEEVYDSMCAKHEVQECVDGLVGAKQMEGVRDMILRMDMSLPFFP